MLEGTRLGKAVLSSVFAGMGIVGKKLMLDWTLNGLSFKRKKGSAIKHSLVSNLTHEPAIKQFPRPKAGRRQFYSLQSEALNFEALLKLVWRIITMSLPRAPAELVCLPLAESKQEWKVHKSPPARKGGIVVLIWTFTQYKQGNPKLIYACWKTWHCRMWRRVDGGESHRGYFSSPNFLIMNHFRQLERLIFAKWSLPLNKGGIIKCAF